MVHSVTGKLVASVLIRMAHQAGEGEVAPEDKRQDSGSLVFFARGLCCFFLLRWPEMHEDMTLQPAILVGQFDEALVFCCAVGQKHLLFLPRQDLSNLLMMSGATRKAMSWNNIEVKEWRERERGLWTSPPSTVEVTDPSHRADQFSGVIDGSLEVLTCMLDNT